jgi:hypothetical protein
MGNRSRTEHLNMALNSIRKGATRAMRFNTMLQTSPQQLTVDHPRTKVSGKASSRIGNGVLYGMGTPRLGSLDEKQQLRNHFRIWLKRIAVELGAHRKVIAHDGVFLLNHIRRRKRGRWCEARLQSGSRRQRRTGNGVFLKKSLKISGGCISQKALRSPCPQKPRAII